MMEIDSRKFEAFCILVHIGLNVVAISDAGIHALIVRTWRTAGRGIQ
jgi:hypothetical protein